MSNSTWHPLQIGDVVDVIAPASKVTAQEVKGAEAFLAKWGLQARIPDDLFGRDVICANTDEVRWRHLKRALLASDSKMIWCLRGGYGANRLLPRLAELKRPPQTKLIMGFSDITSLHVFVTQKWKWPSIHGPMLGSLGSRPHPRAVLKEVHGLLFGEQDEIAFRSLKPMNKLARQHRHIRATVVGGNLMTLQSTLGTPWQIETKGKILFFEETNERGYRVDRMLAHLEHSGALRGVKAVVLGEFLGGQESTGVFQWKPVLQRFADLAPFPVLKGIQTGHGRMQRPVPLNTPSELFLGAKAHLICHAGERR